MSVLRERIERLTNARNRDVWGVRISYTPHDSATPITERADGSGEPLEGVFDAAHLMVSIVDGQEITSRNPMLDLSLEDLGQDPTEGDKFTILEDPHNGETYTVVDVQFDSAQSTKLICVRGDHSA